MLAVSLKLVPSPEFEEKLGTVWIDLRATYEVDDILVTIELPSNEVVLEKDSSYQYALISGESGVKLYKICNGIAIKASITYIKNTLNVIEDVDVLPCTALSDFGSLLVFSEEESKEKFCDVTLTTMCTQPQEGDCLAQAKFYAHRAILTVRSPVFAKMFIHDMQESATSTIKLSDIEPDVLRELLTYIYTSDCPNIKTHAASLLYHAEKYQLVHLKALCERRLSYDLQIDNAAGILLLADAWNAEQLKRNALLFISEHGDEVKLTKEWEDVKSNTELLHNLVDVMFEPAVKRRRLLH